MKKLTTVTLKDSTGPIVVLCPGHVTQKVFNDAFGNEFTERGNKKQHELRYEYWVTVPNKRKHAELTMKCSLPGRPGAKPYTVADWD